MNGPDSPETRDPGESPLPEVGGAFGDYDLLAERGRGGMGVVYRARNRTLGRIVALKVLLPERCRGAEGRRRLRREAHALAQLDHHNIVAVYHMGLQGSFEFIEMQYVDGESLAEWLRRERSLEVPVALRIVEQVAHALSHAHRKGVVHRDIKPANVLLTAEGVAKVLDFGLARPLVLAPDAGLSGETPSGNLCGTPLYMAPEAWSGQPPDPRTDQYSLGVTLYQLLTGRPPFSGDASAQMRQHLLERPITPHHLDPRIPEELSRIIARLMEKNPADRYPSCDELVTDLRLALRPSPVQGREAPAVEPKQSARPTAQGVSTSARWVRSLLAGTGIAALVALLHGVGALDELELRSLDARFAAMPGLPGASPVLVVVTDTESKERLAPDRPLSRERHYGELVAALAGAKAIGMDLLFTDRAAREEDGGLAAMTGLSPRLVHAVSLSLDAGTPASFPEIPESWALDVPGDGLPEASRIMLPVPEVSAATGRVGHVSLSVDPDGVIRRVPHLIRYRGRVYPSLSLAVTMTSLGVGRGGVRRTAGFLELRPPGRGVVRVPVDDHAQMLLNFRWRARPMESRPLWRALAPAVPAVADRVVMVGSSLDGDRDIGALPGRPASPLLWAHATAVDTMLSGGYVTTTRALLVPALVLGLSLAASVAGGVLSPPLGLAASLLVLAFYWGAALDAFRGPTRVWLPVVAPTLAVLGGYLAPALSRLSWQEREKRALAAALSRYLSPAVSRRVLSDPTARRLGGKRKELSVLCAEVESFAAVVEDLEPEEVEEFLAAFFSAMTEVVFRHEGTLDQFSGQGLRAFFGDPEPHEDHALRAIRCAVEMQARFDHVVIAWARNGRPPLRVGIGISTGYVTVGNVGSSHRMQYMALGRSVDEAVLLARMAPGQILVAPRTRALGAERFSFEERAEPGSPAWFQLVTSTSGWSLTKG